MSTNIERTTMQQHQTAALAETREKFPRYFEALNKHPRALVGSKVPAASDNEPGRDADGFVVLKDSADAKEWQEATKQNLVAEIRDNAQRRAEANPGHMQTIHQSIELFQNNSDLVPGTKQFDKNLADRFAAIAKAYEVRDDAGKLMGYSIATQPLIDQLRSQIAAEGKAAPAPASPPQPAGAGAGQAAPKEEAPQAGIQSKSGNSVEGQNMDTFWGTIGLSGIRI